MRNIIILSFVLTIATIDNSTAQDSTLMLEKALKAPDKWIGQVDNKAKDLNERLARQTGKYISSLSKYEEKLRERVAAIDPAAAMQIFKDAKQKYADLQDKMNGVGSQVSTLKNTYFPHLDSLQTAVKFLGVTSEVSKASSLVQGSVSKAMNNMNALQGEFAYAEEVKRFIKEREQFLKDHLAKFNLSGQLKSYQKQVYYYQAQVEEYKQVFQDPSRLERKALEVLKHSKKFTEFFSRHSELSTLFRLPGGDPASGMMAGLEGLQTKEAVMKEIGQRFGSEAKAQDMMKGQIQDAKTQLNQLKDKVAKLGGSGSEEAMPDFKPNGQKTKSLLKRLELGTNLQSVKGNGILPATTDVGLSLGYKLNDKSLVGVGGSYKMGWSRDIRHMSITHQGAGLRSFVDYKLQGSIWLAGGGELNYNRSFRDFDIFSDYTPWQKSALLGLSKKYKAGKKLKGNVQLMYDFLWRRMPVKTAPLVFRFGYTFK